MHIGILRQRVNAGIELLNEEVPGWAQRIDLGELDILFGSTCVLGQVFGNYGTGLVHLGIDNDKAIEYGFFLEYASSTNFDDWNLLTEAWKEKIRGLKD